jgi:hypothetical protein
MIGIGQGKERWGRVNEGKVKMSKFAKSQFEKEKGPANVLKSSQKG